MRAKQAKRLRRAAEEMTTGQPAVTYIENASGSVRLGRNCTRRTYKQLKAGFRTLTAQEKSDGISQ